MQHTNLGPIKGLTTTNPTNNESASQSYPVTVVESGVDGTSWYRKYSDGWIEQGGYVAPATIAAYEQSDVVFGTAFQNAVAFIECQPVCGSTGNGDSGLYGIRNLTNSGFTFQRGSGTSYTIGFYWIAKGF